MKLNVKNLRFALLGLIIALGLFSTFYVAGMQQEQDTKEMAYYTPMSAQDYDFDANVFAANDTYDAGKCGAGDKKTEKADAKTDKAVKSANKTEMKCGAGKCGGKNGKEAKMDMNAKKDSTKAGEMKCGAGKCGGKDAKAAKTDKNAKKAKADEGKEMKCGAGKCG